MPESQDSGIVLELDVLPRTLVHSMGPLCSLCSRSRLRTSTDLRRGVVGTVTMPQPSRTLRDPDYGLIPSFVWSLLIGPYASTSTAPTTPSTTTHSASTTESAKPPVSAHTTMSTSPSVPAPASTTTNPSSTLSSKSNSCSQLPCRIPHSYSLPYIQH